MHHRIVDLDVETEPLHRQCTNRREQGVRGDHAIVLGSDQRNARVTSSCWALSTSSVVRCPTRASSRTPLSAISAAFTCAVVDFDLRLGGIELPPALHHGRPRLVAVDVEIEPLLAQRFFD